MPPLNLITMANPISEFFAKQPFTTYLHQHGKQQRLATDWFPITDPAKIPELIALGLDVDGMKVRKTIKLSDKWQLSNTSSE